MDSAKEAVESRAGNLNEPMEISQFDDPDNYTQAERLRQIMRLREQVEQVRSKAREMRYSRGYSEKQEALYYRTAVESYIMDLATLFQRSDSDTAQEYWEVHKLGEVTIAPIIRVDDSNMGPAEYIVPSEGKDPQGRDKETTRYTGVTPKNKSIPIRGLSSILEAPEQLSAEFQCSRKHSVYGEQTKMRTFHEPIPTQVLDNAVQLADRFRAEVGIDVDLDESANEWEI